jgi:Family of unknown function (DUF5372)
VVAYCLRGGERRVYFRNVDRRIASIPQSFTSLGAPDPFLVVSAGRSHFRIEDLLELSRLIKTLHLKGKEECKVNYAESVKKTLSRDPGNRALEVGH